MADYHTAILQNMSLQFNYCIRSIDKLADSKRARNFLARRRGIVVTELRTHEQGLAPRGRCKRLIVLRGFGPNGCSKVLL